MLNLLVALLIAATAQAQIGQIMRNGTLSVMVERPKPLPAIMNGPTHTVSVNTSDPDTESFQVTVICSAGVRPVVLTSTVQRQASNEGWTRESFRCPANARLISVRVQEIRPVEFPMVEEEQPLK